MPPSRDFPRANTQAYAAAVLHALLLAALAQAPGPRLIVVQGPNLGVHAMRASELLDAMAELARLDGFDATVSPKTCGDRVCLLEVARAEKADAVLSVSFAAVGRDAVMDLDCRDSIAGASIAQLTFTVRANTRSDLVMEPVPFLRQLKSALMETPSLPPEARTEAPKLEAPVCPKPAPPVVVAPPPPRPRSARSFVPFVTGAFSLASAVAAGVLLGVNSVESQSLARSMRGGLIPATRVESALAIDERNNTAIGLFVGAGAAVVLTVVLAWLVHGEEG